MPLRISHAAGALTLRLCAYLFAGSLVVGTLAYRLIEGYSVADALYMAIITISTVGFGEVHPLSQAGRIFTAGYVVVNLGITALFVSQLTQHLRDGGPLGLLRRRLMDREIAGLRQHVIVCGAGRYGREVIEQLAESRETILLVERDRGRLERATALFPDLLTLEGDATQDEVLEEAGVARAKALIVTLSDDSDNAFAVLTAREQAPKGQLTIVARVYQPDSRAKLLKVGADYVVQPEQIGSFFMSALVRRPSAVEFFTSLAAGDGNAAGFEELRHDRLPEDLRGSSLRDMDLRRRTGVSIVAVRYPDGHYEVNPSAEQRLADGMSLIALGDADQLARLRALVG